VPGTWTANPDNYLILWN